ncbi:MAG: DUF2690 domain-containing protein [Actinomycetales bacterium]|nr:DUF2690 domain-containing protein [Actinomycetales bacterium]
MKHLIRLGLIGTATATIVGCLAVIPTNAATNDNVDPQGHYCNNTSTTVATRNMYRRYQMYPGAYTDVYVGKIEHRYSTYCKTAWVRLTLADSSYAPNSWAGLIRYANASPTSPDHSRVK